MIFNIPAGPFASYDCQLVGAVRETITVKYKNGNTVGTVTTDANGNGTRSIPLKRGTYTLSGSVSGHTETVNVTKAGTYKAMPAGAKILYWYGRTENGYTESKTGQYDSTNTITKNTNNLFVKSTAVAFNYTDPTTGKNYTNKSTATTKAAFGKHTVTAKQKLYARFKVDVQNGNSWKLAVGSAGSLSGTKAQAVAKKSVALTAASNSEAAVSVYAADEAGVYKGIAMTLYELYIV